MSLTKATKTMFLELEKRNVVLKKLNALEIFARDGTWQTTFYANKVKTLEVWEVDPSWEKNLRKNLPTAKVRILDSIKNIQTYEKLSKFNLIMIDNPMNIYGNENENIQNNYCEHFDVIKNIDKIMDDESIVVFNVNRHPFDYDKFPIWKNKREKFYGNMNSDNMTQDFLFDFYEKLFKKINFKTLFEFSVDRMLNERINSVYYFVYKLKKL
jgi:hypothetical protein